MEKEKELPKIKRKELGLSCMLNTEVGALLAVIRRPSDPNSHYLGSPEESQDNGILQSLKSLRALIFNPQQQWCTIDPSLYLSPFLDVIQSDDIPAPATGVALSALLKILKFEIFDVKTPGAAEAIAAIVTTITNCRLEKTDPISEDAVLMKILQVLSGIMNHPASALLTDQAVCVLVNTCFQVVQQSAGRGDLLQRSARYTMHELIQKIFSKLPEIEVIEASEFDIDEGEELGGEFESGYGIRCAVDVFHFLCSLLNVVELVETEGSTMHTADEDVQLFALVLINSAVELSGDGIGRHPKLLRMVQDDLFHHLIHYGTCSTPLVLSMICSTVLNTYHFLRRFLRLQIEAFFTFVLLRVSTTQGVPPQLQEVSIEGIINFCRQPTFIIEVYENYDCDPLCQNVFEEIGKLLCKHSFPVSSPLTSLKIQAFEGLMIIIHNIADNIDRQDDSIPFEPYPVEISEFRPFWEDKPENDTMNWVNFLRFRKAQKRKLSVAGYHFNRDEKKGLEYLQLSKLSPDPHDPKALAFFFRYTPGLDKSLVGDFLGDPEIFHLQVLKEFTETFEFSSMILDHALRTYLETFRLPGESQKITRILEAFSDRFYEQQTSDIFASKDAVFILCYSLIMLNTDQHNPQVKKKMTEEEFIRNNRAINGGKDLPKEYLSELFNSISNNAITIFGQSGQSVEMNPSRWIELINRSRIIQPYKLSSFEDHRLGRDMFASIAGPSVATLCAFFEHADEEELLHECVEGLFSIARIAQYGLEETLDELLASFSKFTTLLNPYASAEETLFAFSHDLKPKIATLAVFTIANNFGNSIRGGWKNIVDCLLKLKRLKLLPQSVIEFDAASFTTSSDSQATFEPGLNFPPNDPKLASQQPSGAVSRFSHFLSLESMEDSLSLGVSEFEQNLKIIKQCRIGNIFSKTSNLPEDAVINLGRSLIFSAAGKGQKFSTSVDEEETVGFCWDLIIAITLANIYRFQSYWHAFNDHLLAVAQFPTFSPVPFAEKGIVGLFKVCLKLLGTYQQEKIPEELIFKSINLMWKLEKEILDTCCEFITKSVNKILIEFPANLKTQLGWKSVLHLLSITGRHPETYDQGVETLIMLISDGTHLSKMNYTYCIDSAFSFLALRNSPLEKNIKILDLLASTVNHLVQWYKSQCLELASNNFSTTSNTSNSSFEDNLRAPSSLNFFMSLFIKLGEALRKTSLARREEIRNAAVMALQKCFILAEELEFTPNNCINCFNLVIFAMVDDLHEKMFEYSRRANAERETRSMEGTLTIAMELLTEIFMKLMTQISNSPGFRTFWLGVLRRMDTYMKADLGEYGQSKLPQVVPDLLRKMITEMKENGILVQKEDDDLWEITYIQIQWIAPSIKDELFPEESI
ncbi:ARF guanine-nucleotide exchange factor GNL2 [Humulus lupulus]|uniref:ARF guanine-nucleotide exchange factor GNL2 n=1 Tax=Humulus lupulus TaxID=3486 RepID=UPI002B40F128|nr:ARF guanine-nucleotide exchange factor GNL2 [Humulus lupulus]